MGSDWGHGREGERWGEGGRQGGEAATLGLHLMPSGRGGRQAGRATPRPTMQSGQGGRQAGRATPRPTMQSGQGIYVKLYPVNEERSWLCKKLRHLARAAKQATRATLPQIPPPPFDLPDLT